MPDNEKPTPEQEAELRAQLRLMYQAGTESHDAQEALRADESVFIDATESMGHSVKPDKPPRSMAGRKPRLSKDAKLEASLASLYFVVAMALGMFNAKDSEIVASGATERAHELLAVASHHPKFKEWLIKLTESSDYTSFAIGHGLMILAILGNHNRLPAPIAAYIPVLMEQKSSFDDKLAGN